jgi:hypothetical protein
MIDSHITNPNQNSLVYININGINRVVVNSKGKTSPKQTKGAIRIEEKEKTKREKRKT